jgi:hypothetical protein
LVPFFIKHLCLHYRYLEYEKPIFELEILVEKSSFSGSHRTQRKSTESKARGAILNRQLGILGYSEMIEKDFLI